MPKDNRIFITLAVDMDRHPKFAALNDAQKWLIAKAIMHCREYLTDGQISMTVWRKLGTDRNRKAVLATGVCSEVPEQNCVVFHDYAEHNQTRAEVEASKEKARSAGQKGGLRKAANHRRNREFDTQEPLAPASDPLEGSLSKNVPELEIEKEVTTYVASAAHVSNATAPENGSPAPALDLDKPGRSVPIDGWRLVRDHIPDEHPQPVRSELAIQAAALLHAGTPAGDVEAALGLWLAKPHLGPRALPSLVSEAIRDRTTPATPSGRRKLTAREQAHIDLELMKDHPNPDVLRQFGLDPATAIPAAKAKSIGAAS